MPRNPQGGGAFAPSWDYDISGRWQFQSPPVVPGEAINVTAFPYSAVGDGVANDTSGIQAALDAVSTGGTLLLPRGVYRLVGSRALTATDKSVTIVISPGASIDARDLTSSYVLQVKGSMGTWSLLGASPTAGDRTITVGAALAASLAEGDLVRLSTDPALGGSGTTWRSLGSTNWKGEIVDVLSVTGTVVTLKNALADSYTAANTVAARMNPIDVHLQDVVIRGDVTRTQTAVQVSYLRDLQVRGGNLTGFGHTCLEVDYAAHGVIDGYRASNFWKAGVGNNYGIMLASCQNVRVVNSTISGGRHAVTTGGWEPNRRITIGPGNVLDTDSVGAEHCLAPHSNIDQLKVFGNVLRASCLFPDLDNVEVYDNDIELGLAALTGINVTTSVNASYVRIEGNRVRVAAGITTTNPAIRYLIAGGTTTQRVVIRGNDTDGAIGGINIVQSGTGAATITDLTIADNSCRVTAVKLPMYLVGTSDVHRLTIIEARIERNVLDLLLDVTLLKILYATIGTLWIRGNTFRHRDATGGARPIVASANTTITRAMVDDNSIRNTTSGHAMDVTAVTFISARGNVLENAEAVATYLTAGTILSENIA